MKVFMRPLTGLVFVLCAFSGQAQEQEAPDVLVKRISEEVMEVARSDSKIKAGNLQRIREVVDTTILPHLDVERATSMAVGRHWRQTTLQQRQQLTGEFQTLLMNTYAGAMSKISDQELEFKPMRADPADTEVEVRFQVRQTRGKEPVQVKYRLHKTSGGWKLYDVNVLGVWMVQTYGSSFSAEIGRGGIDGLIRTLSKKNKALAERSAAGGKVP